MKLGIFILHYNTPELTESLHKMVPEAIVIDNGSDPGKKPIVFSEGREYSDLNIYMLDKNYGFTAGWNQVIKHFYNEYDVFWLMNSDIIIGRESIERIKSLLEDTDVNFITPSFNCWMSHVRNANTQSLRNVKVIEFTAPVIKKTVFENTGLFDELFYRGWGVEFDYCFRARKKGFKVQVDDGSNFYHIGQQTINISEGYNSYGKKAANEMMAGMSKLYGQQWQLKLYGDSNYINNIKQ